MGYELCRICGGLRKWGDYSSSDGVHVPACPHCGDPEYTEEPMRDPAGNNRTWTNENQAIRFHGGGWANSAAWRDLVTGERGLRFDAFQEIRHTGNRVAIDLTVDEAEELAIMLLLDVRSMRRGDA